MGIINKLFHRMSTINEAATADCPLLTYTMAGAKDKDALEALTDAIQDWSDGYNMKLTQTWSATYYASVGADELQLQIAFGRGATTTAAANGYYSYNLVWAWDVNDGASVTNSKLEGYYVAVANVGANLDAASLATAVNIYWDSTTEAIVPKYGWTATPTFANTAGELAEGTVVAGTFYMPEEDKKAETETTATGDRLNKKDKVSFLAGPGAPDATCQADVEIELGAATLAAAGSIALAAALSF